MATSEIWTSQTEEYVKLGLFILSKEHKTLQEFSTWINNRLKNYFIEKTDEITTETFEIIQPTLSRYLSGKIGISQKKGSVLLKLIDKELNMTKIIMDKIQEFSTDNWVSINTRVILTDITFLTFIVIKKILQSNDFSTIDAIVTPEADGIPLGVILAQELQCKCIYVRKNKRSEDTDFVQVEVQRYRNVVNYYLSKKELPPDSKVLLVDDIKRSGSTLKHLEELIEKAESRVIKKMVLIDIKSEGDKIKNVDSFLELKSN